MFKESITGIGMKKKWNLEEATSSLLGQFRTAIKLFLPMIAIYAMMII